MTAMEENIKKLINKLNEIDGYDARISITHKLFGNQNILGKVDPFITDAGIGITIKDHHIYIQINNIKEILLDEVVCFSSEIMSIKVIVL